MRSERQQQAAQYRGEGAEAAQNVRANADRERTVILADAQRNGQKLRGAGDAKAIETYAKAYDQDKNFFAFYRSLQAYRDAFAGSNTSFVLNPDSSFFRYFESPTGTAAPDAAAPTPGPAPAAKSGRR
jgi:membrane protease subunit HflC